MTTLEARSSDALPEASLHIPEIPDAGQPTTSLERVSRVILHFVRQPFSLVGSDGNNIGMSEHFDHAQKRNNPRPDVRYYRT